MLSFASFWFPLHSFALLTMLSSENPAETCTAVQPCYHGRRVYSTNSSRSCAHARARKKKRNLAEPCGTLRNLAEPSRNLAEPAQQGKSLRKPLRNLAEPSRNCCGTFAEPCGTLEARESLKKFCGTFAEPCGTSQPATRGTLRNLPATFAEPSRNPQGTLRAI